MATLTGKIADVTGRAPDSISSITVKAPSARIGSGTDVIVSSPAEVTFDKTTGDITISGLTGGLSWLYIEGAGWSDSIPLAVAEGMIALVEAIANAAGTPGLVDYIELLVNLQARIDDIAQGSIESALETKADKTYVDGADQALGQRIDEEKWYRGALGSAVLDTVTTPGTYHQGNVGHNLLAFNYPEHSTGILTVSKLGTSNIAQVYVARTGTVWSRMTTNAGTVWPQWERTARISDIAALESRVDAVESGGTGTGESVPLVEELPPATSWETARTLTTYEQGERFLDSMVDQLPGVSLVELGESEQGNRPIRGLYVGDTTKPVVILECAIHGDENSGREAAYIWAKAVAKSVPSWMEHICFLIIPTANPDSVNIRRGNGYGTDINRSWINQSTSEVRALTGAVDDVNPVFYLSMHEKIDRAWEVELGGNHYPWREGEPHAVVSETVHGAVLSALSEIEPKTRDYGFKMVETDDPATGRAYLGETRNIPVLLAEIGSYNGPGNWSEDVPHPNRFRAPMDKRIKHCIAIFDTVANTMAEIVSGEPLEVTSKTSYPEGQLDGLDDAINSRIDAEKWYRPMLRSGDTLDDKRGADAVGIYPVTAAVAGLPSAAQGWVEVFHNSDTRSTTQRFFAASWAISGEWEREYWAGAWRDWRRIDAASAVSDVAAQLDELRSRVEALEVPTD